MKAFKRIREKMYEKKKYGKGGSSRAKERKAVQECERKGNAL